MCITEYLVGKKKRDKFNLTFTFLKIQLSTFSIIAVFIFTLKETKNLTMLKNKFDEK